MLRLRLFLSLLAAACVLAIPSTAAGASSVRTPYKDAVSYHADLTTTGLGETWAGTETIVVANRGREPLSRVWLRLWGNGPKGCGPVAVQVAVTAGGRAGRLLRSCTAQEVLLTQPLKAGSTTALTLTLTLTTPAVQDRFGTAESINLFGNALPVIAQRDRDGWQLPVYSPYGESFVSSWASFSLRLHHPSRLAVAAAGTTTTVPDPSGMTSTTTSAIEARDTFWAAGDMVEETRLTSRGVKVRAWSSPETRGDRLDAARSATGALQQLERHLPRYPYPEFDVIVARIEAGGGMEYPGIVLTDGASDVTRHETAHQWFYGLVGNDQYREPWVDEGLTSFLEYSWTVKRELPSPRCYPASRLTVAHPTQFVSQSMTYWNRHVARYTFAYNNPVCALRAVRRLIGTGPFGRVMRGLVTDHARGFLTGAEIRRAFRREGGAASDRLFARWGLAPR